jgi:ribosomal protein L29
MQWEDIKNKSKKELQELLTETRNELRSLFFQTHSRQLKQVHKIDAAKKIIARISMALHGDKRKEE